MKTCFKDYNARLKKNPNIKKWAGVCQQNNISL